MTGLRPIRSDRRPSKGAQPGPNRVGDDNIGDIQLVGPQLGRQKGQDRNDDEANQVEQHHPEQHRHISEIRRQQSGLTLAAPPSLRLAVWRSFFPAALPPPGAAVRGFARTGFGEDTGPR